MRVCSILRTLLSFLSKDADATSTAMMKDTLTELGYEILQTAPPRIYDLILPVICYGGVILPTFGGATIVTLPLMERSAMKALNGLLSWFQDVAQFDGLSSRRLFVERRNRH